MFKISGFVLENLLIDLDNTDLENKIIIGEQLVKMPPTHMHYDMFSVDKNLSTDIKLFITIDNGKKEINEKTIYLCYHLYGIFFLNFYALYIAVTWGYCTSVNSHICRTAISKYWLLFPVPLITFDKLYGNSTVCVGYYDFSSN